MKFVLVLLTFILLVTAAPYQAYDERGIPIPPSQDPFYTPAPGYELKPVGTILSSRKMTNLFGIIVIPEKIEAAYQLLIRSEDSFGNANAITAAVYVPRNGDPKKLLSYQVAEDSSNLDCAPSYAFQLFANPITIVSSQLEQLLVQAGLNQGWYVVVPDYEGPKAAFGAGHQAGKATLNGIRGALHSGNITGVSSDAKVALWGYSGGTIASGWAALHQPAYAPELGSNIIGYAIGGIVADVRHTAQKNMGSLFAGLIVTAINGLSHEYPELNSVIKADFRPGKETKFRLTDKLCEIIYIPAFVGATFFEYFKSGSKILDNPVVRKITDDLNMVNLGLTPTKPMFFYNSKFDEIIPADDADALYKSLCARGVSINYEQDLIGGHITQAVLGAGSAFDWLKDRFNGKTQTGCKRDFTFTNALTPEGIRGLGDVIVSAIFTNILGRPLGPYDLMF